MIIFAHYIRMKIFLNKIVSGNKTCNVLGSGIFPRIVQMRNARPRYIGKRAIRNRLELVNGNRYLPTIMVYLIIQFLKKLEILFSNDSKKWTRLGRVTRRQHDTSV